MTTHLSPDEISGLLAAQMPGWRLAPDVPAVDNDAILPAKAGPTLAQLRAKFGTGATLPSPSGGRCTVLAVPPGGGPAKTTDIKNGVATVVQG